MVPVPPSRRPATRARGRRADALPGRDGPPGEVPRARHRLRWADALPLLGGAVAVPLIFLGARMAEPGGSPGMPGATLAAMFARNEASARSGAALLSLAAVAMLLFASALWDRLSRRTGSQWPAALAAGGAGLTAVLLVDWVMSVLASIVAGSAAEGAITSTVLVTSRWDAFLPFAVATTAMSAGVGVAGLRGAVAPWFAWASLSVSALSVVVLATVDSYGAVWLLSLWLLPASVVLALTAWRDRADDPTAVGPEHGHGAPTPPVHAEGATAPAPPAEDETEEDVELWAPPRDRGGPRR